MSSSIQLLSLRKAYKTAEIGGGLKVFAELGFDYVNDEGTTVLMAGRWLVSNTNVKSGMKACLCVKIKGGDGHLNSTTPPSESELANWRIYDTGIVVEWTRNPSYNYIEFTLTDIEYSIYSFAIFVISENTFINQSEVSIS